MLAALTGTAHAQDAGDPNAPQMGMANVVPAQGRDPNLLMIAHPSWPANSQVSVTAVESGRAVTARVVQTQPALPAGGPYVATLSTQTAAALGFDAGKPVAVLLRLIAPVANAPAASAPAARPMTATFPPQAAAAQPAPSAAALSPAAAAAPSMAAVQPAPPSLAAPSPSVPLLAGIEPGLYLQLGAFSKSENAWQLFGKLRKVLGRDVAALEVLQTGDVHRVRAGPFASVAARNEARVKLEAAAGVKMVEVAQ
jgi:rare lipoprotein A